MHEDAGSVQSRPESGNGAGNGPSEGVPGQDVDHTASSSSLMDQVRRSRRLSAPTLPRLPPGARVVMLPVATPTGTPTERQGFGVTPAGATALHGFSFSSAAQLQNASDPTNSSTILKAHSARSAPRRNQFVHVSPAMRHLDSARSVSGVATHQQAVVVLAPLSESGPTDFVTPHGGVKLHSLLEPETHPSDSRGSAYGSRSAAATENRGGEAVRPIRKRRSLSMSAATSRAKASRLPSRRPGSGSAADDPSGVRFNLDSAEASNPGKGAQLHGEDQAAAAAGTSPPASSAAAA